MVKKGKREGVPKKNMHDTCICLSWEERKIRKSLFSTKQTIVLFLLYVFVVLKIPSESLL